MKKLIKKLENLSLAQFEQEKELWSELVKVYHKKTFELGKELEKKNKESAQRRYQALIRQTSYCEPEYPNIGVEGTVGDCVFKDQAEAEELINILVSKSYYYGHELKWQGPGRYKITPEFHYDHDQEIVYTAVYKKE